jgi:hypothetical protein
MHGWLKKLKDVIISNFNLIATFAGWCQPVQKIATKRHHHPQQERQMMQP